MDSRDLTRRILERVRLRLHRGHLTQREVEKRVGFSRGYLSQLLAGSVEIKLWQLLAVLYVLDLEPADFFAELFPRRRHPALEALDDLGRQGQDNPLSVELARLFAFGIESVFDFYDRLVRLEEALDELTALGVLDQ